MVITAGVGTAVFEYIPPSPINLTNTTGNYWVNHSWQAGVGNVTDLFNISVNGTWINNTSQTYYNHTVVPSGWSSISVYAYNSSGNGTLSLISVTDTTQAPSAPIPDITPPIAVAGPDQTIEEDKVVRFNGSLSSDNIGIVNYSWDFNANDGITIDATGVTTNHIYTVPGTYTVTLNVTDNASNSATDTLTVKVTNATTSSNTGNEKSGVGSGSTGTSGETFKNILCTETDRRFISKDQEVSFNFELECNYVKYINFTGLVSFGKEAVKVEILNHTSSLVDKDAPGVVFSNLNVWIGSFGLISENNVNNPTISFIIDKSWVKENGITLNTIYLYSYDDSRTDWEKMYTKKIGEDSTTYYYQASLPVRINIGPLAISGSNVSSPSMLASNSSIIQTILPTHNTTVQPTEKNNTTITPIIWTGFLKEKLPPGKILLTFFVIISIYIGISHTMANKNKVNKLPAMMGELFRTAKKLPIVLTQFYFNLKEKPFFVTRPKERHSHVPDSFWHKEPDKKIVPIKVPAPIPGRTSKQTFAIILSDEEQIPDPEHSRQITKRYPYSNKINPEMPSETSPEKNQIHDQFWKNVQNDPEKKS
ncbi:MAG: PGF-pre-PGF domain-containing protein [ANME-2 cluster archaeon]|nr:PGF-pre-PGF domain-containing protein [ANME-2 cluster archaeon]